MTWRRDYERYKALLIGSWKHGDKEGCIRAQVLMGDLLLEMEIVEGSEFPERLDLRADYNSLFLNPDSPYKEVVLSRPGTEWGEIRLKFAKISLSRYGDFYLKEQETELLHTGMQIMEAQWPEGSIDARWQAVGVGFIILPPDLILAMLQKLEQRDKSGCLLGRLEKFAWPKKNYFFP